MRKFVAILTVFAATQAALPAAAQQISEQDLRNFSPPTDPESALYLEKPTTEGAGAYNVGVWFSYANQLLLLETSTGDQIEPLRHQFSADYVASLGLTERISLGLALPTIVHQQGDDSIIGELPESSLGDLRAELKGTLLQPGNLGTLALASLFRVTLPTSRDGSYVGHDTVTGEGRLLSELSYVTTKLQATFGVRVRDDVMVLGDTLGSDLPWGAAALWAPSGNAGEEPRFVLAAETHGAIGLEPAFADELSSPILGGLSARLLVGDWSMLVGCETSFNSGMGGPRLRAVLAAGYAPRIKDADQDGLEDHVDECPLIAEDRDGFQDSDGCPEVDNDGDGVSDTDDRCPRELEDHDGFEDNDGCPDPDNDRDGVLDAVDACKDQPGKPSEVPKFHGCPPVDSDNDGIFDDRDRCPSKAEDKDGFKDEDGCPDRDNDRDRIPDQRDACPDTKGPKRSDPKLNGCPNPDRDGDTFSQAQDRCPNAAETFNGIDDDDGCPEREAPDARPLIELLDGPAGPSVRLSRPIEFVATDGGVELAPASMPLLRALGLELNRHPDWVLLVGIRPVGTGPDAEQEALNKSFAIVLELHALTYRDDSAESVSYNAVKGLPHAADYGMGFMVLAPDRHTHEERP